MIGTFASATPVVSWRKVPWYRECPHCYTHQGGVGNCHTTIPPDEEDSQIGRRYYKCDTCGLGFSREFEVAISVIEKRTVTVIRR